MKQQLVLVTFLAVLLFLTAACSLSTNPSGWQKYSFNGRDFQSGGSDNRPAIWIRDGYTPRVEEPRDASLDYGTLPPDSGAVAGICYLQTSGGKLADQRGSRPLPDEQITIKSEKYGIAVTRSDAAGFFIEELFPGEYQFFCRGTGVSIRVKEGKTVLVPLKGAKRMAD